MGQPRSTLVILRHSELGSEIRTLTSVSNQMEPGGMEFTATKAMAEMRRNPRANLWRLSVTYRNLRSRRWSSAGNSAHTLKAT